MNSDWSTSIKVISASVVICVIDQYTRKGALVFQERSPKSWDHTVQYQLLYCSRYSWHDELFSSVRLYWIMWNLSIMTWWISQVSQVKLDHVKSYWFWHDESVSSAESYWVLSNHINYDTMYQSDQSGKIGSCQIILIMTLFIS